MVDVVTNALIVSFADGAAPAAGGGGSISMFTIMIIALIVMMGFSIYSQKKRGKKIEQMRAAIDIGDEIITIGGFAGVIVDKTDEEFIIESESTRLRVKKWAIQSVVNKENAEVPTTRGTG